MVAEPGAAKPYFQIAKERKAAVQGKVKLTGVDKVKADNRYGAVCRLLEKGKSNREISEAIGIGPQTVGDMREAWENEKAAGGSLDGVEPETVQ
jgi:DNA-binding NarL/FixJ family response regulator